MTSTGRLLCLLLCCWYVADTRSTNPGLKIRLSQPGLNYAATVAVRQMSAKVRRASLPDQSGSVGKVAYEVKNMKVGVEYTFIIGPHNGPVLFCWLASVVVCNAAGGRAGRPPKAWERGMGTLPAVGRPTLHGGPVVLRLVRATPCFDT